MDWMVSRGPPALTACPPGDSSNTRLLSARTNIWESVMKGLEEKEGVSQNPENSHSSTSTTGSGGGCGKGSGGVRAVECGGSTPTFSPPSLGPELHGEAQGRGAGDWASGRPRCTASPPHPWCPDGETGSERKRSLPEVTPRSLSERETERTDLIEVERDGDTERQREGRQ